MEDAVEGLALALQEYARVHHLMQAGCTLLGWFRKTWPGLALRSLVQGESQQTRRVIMQGHTHIQSGGIKFALLFFRRFQAAPRYFQVLQE